jgi:NADH dehydrogenase FAD-containing subunit
MHSPPRRRRPARRARRGTGITYDDLVVALGGTNNPALIPGSESALTFKCMSYALLLRNHLLERFERADAAADPTERKRLLTTSWSAVRR